MRKLIIFMVMVVLLSGTLFAEDGNPDISAGMPLQPTIETNPIRILYPSENARLPAFSSIFVGGSVPFGGKLMINGKEVPVHPGGGFVTMLDLTPGVFRIQAELQLNGLMYYLTRTVYVSEPESPLSASPLTLKNVTPKQDQQLLPGDNVKVTCKGSPGMEAYFTVEGIDKKFPMSETQPSSGIYQGVYRIGWHDPLNQSKITVTLKNQYNEVQSKDAAGRVSLFPNDLPVMVETVANTTVLRAGPAVNASDRAGYMMFLPKATLLQVTGKKGDEYRVRLNRSRTVWVSASQVRQLPQGTLPNNIVVGSIALNREGQSTIVRIPLSRKIPFLINPDAEGHYVDIILFGAYSNTDWINNASTGCIKQLSWFQEDEETYRLRVVTPPGSWWGYDARYEDGQFIFELRMPPPMYPYRAPLEGLTIAVDAGHGNGGGAIGLTGFPEGDANLAIAMQLKEKLTAQGAKVVMIRADGTDVPLNLRTGIAWQNKADILISIHNNSLGPRGNPLQKHGYGVYYHTPMSLPLAKEIHKAYGERFVPGGEYNLPDDGLYQANLALIRAPQMPSVLIESAYMIVPEEEAYLKTAAFREACADAIVTGLERYVRRMRK